MSEPLRKVTEFVGQYCYVPYEGDWFSASEAAYTIGNLMPDDAKYFGRWRITVEWEDIQPVEREEETIDAADAG